VASAIEKPELLAAGQYLIEQDWFVYPAEKHAVWGELVRRRMPELREHACQEYLDGFEFIGMREDSIPNLAEVNQRLEARTGWNATPVSGFLPPHAFFEMLAARRFPTTTWLRERESLEYTPEPDIFHDCFGHVPMHAHPVFADFLQQYGKVCAGLRDKDSLERMGRLFWFTVEFGVIRQNGTIKLYGSGLISSQGESNSVIRKIEGATGDGPEIRDFNLGQVLDQEFVVSEMQKVLYAVESFEQIYEAAQEAERRLQSESSSPTKFRFEKIIA
jgi:phenylalanine-4-hydroxylase